MVREEKTGPDLNLYDKESNRRAPKAGVPSLNPTWRETWKIPSFRRKFWIGLVVLGFIFAALPFFFQAIEARNGYFFNDMFLQWLPARNVSVAVFFLIWSCCLILVIRIFRDPMILLNTLWAYNGVTLLRMACIGLVSLNPPAGLIPMADPITNQFYGAHYITHDLFFSGHTTTVFLIFLCLKKRTDRLYALLASVLLALLLLIQHVHYTVDVLAAPVFTYAVFRLTLLFTKNENKAVIQARKN